MRALPQFPDKPNGRPAGLDSPRLDTILTYAARILEVPVVMGDIYVVNGFYATMQAEFTAPGSSIYYYSVQWNAAALPWAEFRSRVVGATDPALAVDNSLRKHLLKNWQALGLDARPSIGQNGVHASASPFEGLAERMNWLAASIDDDETGQALLEAGIKKQTLLKWTKDPQAPPPFTSLPAANPERHAPSATCRWRSTARCHLSSTPLRIYRRLRR